MRLSLVAALTIGTIVLGAAGVDAIDFGEPQVKVRSALLRHLTEFVDIEDARHFLKTEGFVCTTTNDSFLTQTRVLARRHLYCTKPAGGMRAKRTWHVGILYLPDGITGVVVFLSTIYM